MKQGLPVAGRIAPHLVLALMLSASVWGWRFWANAEQAGAQSHFNEYCERISQDITGRVHAYRRVLQSGAGIFVASENVTRQEWRAYFEYRTARTQFPGMLAFAYAEVVAPAGLAQHVARIQTEGFPEYRVWPEGDRPLYTPVVFLEPFDETNRRALGFDVSSEPVRRAAMERARDTATVAMSGRVRLVVGDTDEDVQAGYLIYAPFFSGGVPPAGVEVRRAALTGYVFAALRVKDLMRGIFPEAPEQVAFELYDGTTVSPESLLFKSSELGGVSGTGHQARFSSHIPLDLYGHTWSLVLRSTPKFDAEKAPHRSWIILAAGLIVSILVFRLIRSQQNVVVKAKALAERLTVDLHESEEMLRATLYSIGDAVISTDAEGRVVGMNPVAVALTGWSEQAATGQPLDTVFRIVNEQTGQPVDSPARVVLKEGRIVGLANHTLLIARDGRQIPIADSGAPIRNAAGDTAGVVLVFRDQTEERKALLALESSRQRLESMFRAVPVGIGMACGDNITTANARLCEITGYACDELIGQSIRMLYTSQEEFERCGFGDGEQIERTGIDAIETVWQRKDGTRVDVLFSVSPVAQAGAGNNVTFTARDITERKQAEADRSARQAAEEANRAKSAFLANMSHEIRTPLNAVLGFAQILKRDDTLTPRQVGMLHTIGRSGRHLLNLINDILDMSKIESGRFELRPADFCLQDLLDDVEMMFRSRAQARQLQFLVERDESVPRYINADEGKLRQVLINLMSNAVKFTKTGGVAVRIRCETATNSSNGESNILCLVVEVEDSGPGIAEEELERIFEPFRQSGTARDAGGTGLGLAVSRRIVDLMGGSLTVKSQVGKGSCFRFDALVKSAEGAAQEIAPAMRQVVGLEPGSGPFRILVADDQKDNRDLLAALLEPLDFEIREAINGQEALDIFQTWSPHAVLMDMRMPVLDGYEATRRIKTTGKGRGTSVIAVTASAFDDAEKEVLAAGVDGYVRKPFRSEEIFAVLEKCLGLRYVYADNTGQTPEAASVQPLTRADLALLPETLRQAMRQAVDEGDMAGLQALITQVEETDAEAAHKLRNLADQYDYGTLSHVLVNLKGGEPDE